MEGASNIGEHISRAVAAQLDAAFVEKEVETRVGKLVVEAVDHALRRYSDTGKLITDAVEASLRVDRLDLPSYGDTVAAILKVQIESRVSELVAGRLAADMAELLSLAPKEIKLSQIAAEMLKEHSDGYGEVITVIVEVSEYGSTWIYLDEQTHHEGVRASRECRHQLLLSKDGTISSATIDRRNTKDVQHIGRSFGLGQRIRAFIACGTRIIVDEGDVVTSVGDY